MSRSYILLLAIAVFLGSFSSFMGMAYGQVPLAYMAVSVRPDSPANTCDNAPPGCLGAGWISTQGRHEFDVYRYWGAEYPTDAARFCMSWPETWDFVSSEVCYGSLVSGDPSIRGALLEFAFLDCPYADGPFLRIVLECPTPGSFHLGCDPSVKVCGSPAYWIQESIPARCDVGDWCGRLPNHPCDWCSMSYRQAAGFDVPSLELSLPPGQIWSGVMYVSGDLGPDCGAAPECGGGYGACFGDLGSDVPWMTQTIFWPPGDGYQHIPFRLRVDSSGLAPGRYGGNIVSEPNCSWCISNCMPVTLTVLDPAAVGVASPMQATRFDGPYPNPAADRIAYAITLAATTRTRVTLFDVAGRRLAELLDSELPAGSHDFTWIVPGNGPPSGSYVLRLEAGPVRQSRLVVLAR